MALSLEQLTAAYKKADTNESRPSNYYRFFDAQFDQRVIVRFLPDANENNPLGFMVEKLVHNLEINGERKSVPCLKMYDEECPICKVSAAYYADEGKGSVNGKKYWRNKQHIAQALVMEDPLPADQETGENSEGKVKFINIGFQLYSVIKEAFESGELDDVPYLYENGCNFIIKKTEFGDRAKYDVGSKFARKSTDLTEDEIAFVSDEIVDLSTLIPANPGHEKIEAMLNAALTNTSYDESGNAEDDNKVDDETPVKSSKPEKTTTPAKKKAASSEEEFEDESDDILAIIQNRKRAAAE